MSRLSRDEENVDPAVVVVVVAVVVVVDVVVVVVDVVVVVVVVDSKTLSKDSCNNKY